jgi:sugar phosphate isomerase/epimerase
MCSEPGCGLFALSDDEFEKELLKDRAAIEAAGLEICQTHGVWPYDDTKPEQWELKFEAMVKSIKGTAILGSKYVIVHPVLPFGWNESPHHEKDVRENIEYMKKLVPYAEKYDVKIALENMPNPHVPCGRVEELVECIDTVNSEYLVACLDVGHSTALGYDAGDAVRMLGGRIHCLHIHDNDGRRDLHLLPYHGVTNWKHFTEALKEIGYGGTMSLETAIWKLMPGLPDELMHEGNRWAAKIMRHLAAEASR